MALAIPAAVKAIGTSSQELVRNTSSYLALAAIHNSRLLAQHSVQLISNIIHGLFLSIFSSTINSFR